MASRFLVEMEPSKRGFCLSFDSWNENWLQICHQKWPWAVVWALQIFPLFSGFVCLSAIRLPDWGFTLVSSDGASSEVLLSWHLSILLLRKLQCPLEEGLHPWILNSIELPWKWENWCPIWSFWVSLCHQSVSEGIYYYLLALKPHLGDRCISRHYLAPVFLLFSVWLRLFVVTTKNSLIFS